MTHGLRGALGAAEQGKNKQPQAIGLGLLLSCADDSDQAKWLKALLASAMRWVFSRFWIVVPVLL